MRLKCYVIAVLIFSVSINVAYCQSKPYPLSPVTIGYADTIASKILGEKRPINIYLPEGYSPDSATTYPVIYLLDGGVDEDFIHISGLVRYLNTPWLNRFPASIVVGIESVNRRKDFTFATADLRFVTALGFDSAAFKEHGNSAAFMAFIEQELQPYVNKHYKAAASKTVIGESLGGLFATEVLLKKPTLFDTYIIVSPSLWWGRNALLKNAATFAAAYKGPSLRVCIAAPNKKEDEPMFATARELATRLQTNRQVKTFFDYLPAETHASVLHIAVYRALYLLNPKK